MLLHPREGSVRLDGLPGTVQVGLFATSPGDLTLRRAGWGATVGQAPFTQAFAPSVAAAGWTHPGRRPPHIQDGRA